MRIKITKPLKSKYKNKNRMVSLYMCAKLETQLSSSAFKASRWTLFRERLENG